MGIKINLDIQKAAERLGLEKDEYIDILKLFIEISRTDLEKMESALERKDMRAVFETCHSLKGAAINLCFEDIAEIARDLELNARKNILDGADEGCHELKTKIERLSGIL